MTSDIIKPMKKKIKMTKLPLLAGCIGTGAAREFVSFCEVFGRLPTIAEILSNPQGIPIPNEPSVKWSLAGLIGHHMSVKNHMELLQFVTRLDADFQVIALRGAMGKTPDLLHSPGIMTWVKDNSKELIQQARS